MKSKPFIILISMLLLLIALSTGCTTKKKLHAVTTTESTVSDSKDASTQVATSDVLTVQQSSTSTTLQTDLSAQITEEYDTDRPTDKSTGTPPLKKRVTAINTSNAQQLLTQITTTLQHSDSTAQATSTSKADSTGRATSNIDQSSSSKPPNLLIPIAIILLISIILSYAYASSKFWIPKLINWLNRSKDSLQ